MKPVAAISAIVVAVLVTVVIEETRIKKLQDELTRLRALPSPEAVPPESNENPPPASPDSSAPETPAETPAAGEEPTRSKTPPGGLRKVPSDYPEPDETRIRQLDSGPYQRLHLELGLTLREASYLDEVLSFHRLEMQKLAATWIAALPDDRALIETAMDQAEADTMQRIRNFLGSEEDFATFVAYHAMQPERDLLTQITPILEQQGVALVQEKEIKLLDSMRKARETVGGIDWNSPEAIKVIAGGDALKHFEEQWTQLGKNLAAEVGDFLEPAEIEALLAAREQVKALQLESLKESVEAVGGGGGR